MTCFASLLWGPTSGRCFPDAPLDPPSSWLGEPRECRRCLSGADDEHRCSAAEDCGGCERCCPDRLFCSECGNRASEGCLAECAVWSAESTGARP